jgi:4'-phosphopantetheinyl transferase
MATGVQELRPLPWPLANEVHIHSVSLATDVARYVSPEEILRADRLLDPHKRNRSIASKGLLREILGRYLEMQPEEIRFSVGRFGKPYLCSSTACNRLHFNLSHSGSLFLLAISADHEIGIDVEQIRPDTPFTDIARLVFSPREQNELLNLPDGLQINAFYRCWTHKEAYLKACGKGFSLQPNSFDVSLLPKYPVILNTHDNDSDWKLFDIIVPENYHAALAVQLTNPIFRYM